MARIPSALNEALVPPIPSALSIGFRTKSKDSTTVLLAVDWAGSLPEDESGYAWDGRLGSAWFANRVWTMDYPNWRFYFDGTKSVAPTDPSCWVPLGFQTDSTGHRTNDFHDHCSGLKMVRTSSSSWILGRKQSSRTALGGQSGPNEPRHRATSFITTQRFEQWHKKHPEWLVVPNAEKLVGAAECDCAYQRS